MKSNSKRQLTVVSRGDFIKSACLFGLCGCVGTALAADQPATPQTDSEELRTLRERLDFVQIRFARLVEILGRNLDEPTVSRIFEELGVECARQFKYLSDKFKGDLDGFLAHVQERWVEKVEHDKQNRTIRITDRSPKCSCALVRQGMTPGAFCDCSRGWQKEIYSLILGKPVEVKVEQSILRGAPRCAFLIRYA